MPKAVRLFVCFLFAYSASWGQVSPTVIKCLGVEDGLSNNVVNSLYHHCFGFMWMGTYDGYNFKIYRNKWNENNSLIYNHITALDGDGKDRIWIGTQKGISVFDYADSKIHPVIYQAGKKKIKITATNGLFNFDKNSSLITKVPFKLSSENVMGLSLDKDQKLWIATNGGGLSVWNPKFNRYKNYVRNAEDPNSLTSNFVSSILKDKFYEYAPY
ncbi:hypothetical protein EZ449_04790 [Pedobacter frigidisoli]|uniref:Two component regulator propeller n=1 Tax=Pedobacter frigidisoli TaxID=2530455 RepID=A0A4V2MN69_9SPHI|nr:two-component regulator propeller domain-containing protein [Pedobacter frigidisoli]TCD11580.1 hypothetical protein EZ449_04790 [Pedobacter frigidisoli]